MRVQAESVDVLMVVSGIEADEVPITTSCKRSRAITLGLLILSDLKNDRYPIHQISKLRADLGDCGGSKVKCSRPRVGGGAVLGSRSRPRRSSRWLPGE